MVRKVSLEKIENVTKCQVTFSKRRSSLMKKAQEVSICCDAEVALVAFSPSGRLSKFSSPKRIEEVVDRYVNLPPARRFNAMDNVQEKLDKLRQLDHIKCDKSKLYYLDKQLENLELQIKKSTLQLQILKTEIGVYEPQGQEPTLNQLIWHERNIKNSLGKVIARKNIISVLPRGKNNIPMSYQGVTPFFNNFLGRDSNSRGSYSSHGKHQMLLDPWLVPHSANREGPLQSLMNQEYSKSMRNQGLARSTDHSTYNSSEKIQPCSSLIGHESQFVPSVKNAFRSVAQNTWNVFGNGSLSKTLQEIQPTDHERTTPLFLDENLGTGFAFSNGQITTDKTQARNNQIFPPSGQLNINHPNVFDNTNIHIRGKKGKGREIEDSNPLKNLMKDNTPWTSHSQERESGLFDREWDSLTYDDLNNFLD